MVSLAGSLKDFSSKSVIVNSTAVNTCSYLSINCDSTLYNKASMDSIMSFLFSTSSNLRMLFVKSTSAEWIVISQFLPQNKYTPSVTTVWELLNLISNKIVNVCSSSTLI